MERRKRELIGNIDYMHPRNRVAAGLLLLLLIMIWYGAPASAWADDFSNKFDTGTTVVSPLLYFLLQDDEDRDPKNTVLSVKEMSAQGTSTQGSLNRVAEYIPLDSGIKLRDLFYQKAMKSNFFTLQVDSTGIDSRRLVATLDSPDTYYFRFKDTRVLHRLEHQPEGIDFDYTPQEPFSLTWEKADVDGDVNLSRNGSVHLYGCYSYQIRSGDQQHSFFQVHQYNCTSCHTLSASRGISQTVNDWKGGAYAKLGNQSQTVLDAHARSSEFSNNGMTLTYPFGGSIGQSALYPTNSSRDNGSGAQLYMGEGRYRLGAHGESIERRNLTTNQTLRNNYLSIQGVANPTDNLAVNAGYYTHRQDNSLPTALSSTRDSVYLQAAYTFSRGFNVHARFGQDNRDYSVRGIIQQGPFPNSKDRYYDLRATYRPDRHWWLSAGYRDDTIDNPYLPTDPNRKSVTDLAATYSNSSLTAGAKYRATDSSNTVSNYSLDELTLFMTAQFKNNLLWNVCYADNKIDSHSAYTFLLDDSLGNFMPLQTGYPYWANNNAFMTSLTIPLGGKKPWHFIPLYRSSTTESNANLLPQFPTIPLAAKQRIRQDGYGARLDFPLKKEGTRLGVGWEYYNWTDEIRSRYSGSYNTYMINFSKRY